MSDNKIPISASRRQFLVGVTAAGGMTASGWDVALTPTPAPEPTHIQGVPPSVLGGRSPHEALKRLPAYNLLSLTPLESLHGTITPADLHFERHHGGVPQIDPVRHELLIHGMVDKPLKFSLDDLKRFPSVTRTCFIECSGNLDTRAEEKSSPRILCGLTSQSEWTGVALSTLFREVGVKPKASWFLA